MKRVLVVDDTKNIRILLTKCLELEGYAVRTAIDGQEALELFRREAFDLAFLDIKMPHFSGTEVLKQIREQGIRTPVIIITAYATIKNAVECTQMGSVAYLQKPFTAEKVRTVLNDLSIAPEQAAGLDGSESLILQIEHCQQQGEFLKSLQLLKTAVSIEPGNEYLFLLFSKAYRGIGDDAQGDKFRRIYEALCTETSKKE